MENYNDIEYMLIVRRKVPTIYDNLGYAFANPTHLINLRLPGFDYFVRYYNGFNKIYGKKLKKITTKNRIDIIHSHGPPDDLGFISKEYTEIPMIHEVFDTSSLYDTTNYGGWIKGKFIERLGLDTRLRKRLFQRDMMWEKYVHENVEGIVYTSKYMLTEVKKIYNFCGESIVIPNAVLRKDIPTKKLPKLSEKDGEIHTVYVGAISVDMGHRNILPTLTKITDEHIHVHIYGLFNSSVRLSLENTAKKNHYFHIHKPLPYSKLYTELTKFNFGLVLLAPFNERLLHVAIPNKIFEYLVSDLPVIVSPYDSLSDFVKRRNCGFVLDEVKDIHSKIGKKYYIGNKEEYTIEYHIPKLIKLYERMLY